MRQEMQATRLHATLTPRHSIRFDESECYMCKPVAALQLLNESRFWALGSRLLGDTCNHGKGDLDRVPTDQR